MCPGRPSITKIPFLQSKRTPCSETTGWGDGDCDGGQGDRPSQYRQALALKGGDVVLMETSWGAPGCHHLVNWGGKVRLCLAPTLPATGNPGDPGACSGHRACPQPPAGPAQAYRRPQPTPGGLAFYDLPLTSRVSPLQLWASQGSPRAISIANVSAFGSGRGNHLGDEETGNMDSPGPRRETMS